ncbi:hypothetical protein AVEN_163031-1, partial [Araneus ventricosus]
KVINHGSGMQLEFLSQPKPSGTPNGAARSGPAQHDMGLFLIVGRRHSSCCYVRKK